MLISILLSLLLNFNNNFDTTSTPPFEEVNFSDSVSLEPFTMGVETSATSSLAIDLSSDRIIFAKNIYQKRPVASLTKLMTALVFLENRPDWDEWVEMNGEEEVGGARLKIESGEIVKVEDLFKASLVASTNNGVMGLVKSTGLSEKEFVDLMNKKAKAFGMRQTSFAEPTGMSTDNVSTAYDISILVKQAFAKQEIVEAVKLPSYDFATKNNRSIRVYNTDILLDSFLNKGSYQIIGAKTGFINEAGYCLATRMTKGGHEIVTVVLNSETIEDRFSDTKALAYWTFKQLK